MLVVHKNEQHSGIFTHRLFLETYMNIPVHIFQKKKKLKPNCIISGKIAKMDSVDGC